MKKSSWKLVLCLALAAVMLMCTALAAIEQADVAADDGTTITVTGGKLTLTTTGLTSGTQYVLMQVKTDVAGDSAQAILTAAKTAQNPYVVGEETIIYIDQAASDGSITFSDFQPKVAANSLFILGGDAQPKIVGAMIARGVTVSGTVTAKGAAATDTAAKVELLDGTSVVAEANVALTNGAGSYSLESVPDGTYTLKVTGTAGKYVAREYAVTVAGSEVAQNVEIWPRGDASGDGRVNLTDYNQVLRHVRGTSALQEYPVACADTNGDTRVNLTDYNQILRHVRGTSNLW